MSDNIKRRLVTYEEALKLVRKEYMSKKAKYDRSVDHVSLYDLAIQLDLERDKILIPSVRGHLKTSLKYPLAEYLWYQSEDRRVNVISEFGPIWKKMVDENDLVQSNYGYQISRVLKERFGEEDYLQKAARELYDKKELIINILDDTNINCHTDTPCNNVFKFTWKPKSNQIKAVVVARSLDLIFGYPYDVFYVQMVGHQLINEMKKIDDRNYWLREVQYIPINGHIYLKDLDPKVSEKWKLAPEEFVEVDAAIVNDLRVSKKACKQYKNSDYYRDIRKQLISEYGRGFTKVPQRLNNVNRRQPELDDSMVETFRIHLDTLPDGYYKDLENSLTNGAKCYYDSDRMQKFLEGSLNTDRKVAIYIPTIEYNKTSIVYLNRDMHVMPYPNDLIVSVVKWVK